MRGPEISLEYISQNFAFERRLDASWSAEDDLEWSHFYGVWPCPATIRPFGSLCGT
jgi:hypothetical protein